MKEVKKKETKKQESLLRPDLKIVLIFLVAIFAIQLSILTINGVYKKTPVLGLYFDSNLVGIPTQINYDHTILSREELTADNKPIKLTSGNWSETAKASDCGITADSNVITQEVYGYGREKSFWTSLLHQDLASLDMVNLKINYTGVNKTKLISFADNLNEKISTVPSNAGFLYIGGKLTVVAGEDGIIVNVKDVENALKSVKVTDTPVIAIPTISTNPVITTAKLNALLPEANQIADTPINATVQGQTVAITSEDLAGLITPTITGQTVGLSINQSKISTLLGQLTSKVYKAASPNVSNGVSITSQGTPGQELASNASSLIYSDLVDREENKSFSQTNQSVSLAVQTIYPSTVIRGPYPIHLTIDDSPTIQTPQILSTLQQYNVHATFFIIGQNAAFFPLYTQEIVQDGNAVGNHTYTHPMLTSLPLSQVQAELEECQQTVLSLTGVNMTVWRPPYSAHNASIDAVAASMGLSLELYSDNPNDSTSTPGPAVIAQRVIDGARPGAIIIIHSEDQGTQALPAILSGLKAKDYDVIP
jgi:hypothetical protein